MSGISSSYLTAYNEDAISTLMTVSELAEYLNIGKNRAYDLLKSGTIKGFRIGCTWKVSKTAVDSYILKESGLN